MTWTWTPEQRAVITAIAAGSHPRNCPACAAGLPTSTYTAIYAPREIEMARDAAARERVSRRWRLARRLTIAIGWTHP